MAHSPYERTADQYSDFKDETTLQVSRMTEQAEGASNRLAEQAREAGAGMQEVAGNMKSALDKSLHDQPLSTLALVAMVGFFLGAIWKT
jgi:ElaB/YqjD/DUF883 family membrane-anchored ribosome-binding protein